MLLYQALEEWTKRQGDVTLLGAKPTFPQTRIHEISVPMLVPRQQLWHVTTAKTEYMLAGKSEQKYLHAQRVI